MRYLLIVVLCTFSLVVHAQSNNKGATPVEVENGPNNPVPVTVENTPDVHVANSRLDPVPVSPVRTPHSQTISQPLNSGDTSFNFAVPMDSIWVVENISYRFDALATAECAFNADIGILFIRISGIADNQIEYTSFLPTPDGDDNGTVMDNREITLYAGPAGTSAFLKVITRASPPGPSFCASSGEVTLIGYLLPAAT